MQTNRSVLRSAARVLAVAAGLAASFTVALAQPAEEPVRSIMRPAGQAKESGETGMQSNVMVPLIPRAALFGNPDRVQGRISPDGKHMAFIAPHEGVLNVFVAPLGAGGMEKPKVVTSNKVRGVSGYYWAYDSSHVLYQDDEGGDENFRIYAVNVENGEKKDLTPLKGVRAEIAQVSPKFPDEVVLALNDRDPMHHDLYRVNVKTGERTLLKQNDDWAELTIDEDYKVRFGSKVNQDGSVTVSKFKDDGSTETFMTIPMEDTANTAILGFDASGKTLYLRDSTGRDTSGLYEVNMETGARTLLFSDDQADVGGVIVHPKSGLVQAVESERERARWNLLGEELVNDFRFLKKTNVTGDMMITSRTLDDRFWTVSFVDDDGPAKTYLYDRGLPAGEGKEAVKPSMTFLFANRPDIEKMPLVKMHPVTIKSRDGLDMVCYYSLPMERDPDGNGKPDRAVPMVLNVHGGPWARDSWGFHPEHQWLANRGYAVLSVNYRGSEGFGKKFLNAANKEWAGKMHDDLIDAVNWAVEQGIAEKDKVAIYGGSYGGYATLVGLTFTPDTFACGVDIVGPSNLITLLNSFPPYWAPAIDMMTKRMGDHRTPEGQEFLKSRSPLTFVDKISKPLLIGQGANDPRVKQPEADQIVAAMKLKNLPVTYLLYPDEGHGFARPQNRMSFYATAEAFLAQHLGGRVEPFGEAFKGSSVEVREGADQIPGLNDAVQAK